LELLILGQIVPRRRRAPRPGWDPMPQGGEKANSLVGKILNLVVSAAGIEPTT
jgi:hypothetical protein